MWVNRCQGSRDTKNEQVIRAPDTGAECTFILTDYPPNTQCNNGLTMKLRQNGRHFPDNIFKCIFLNEKLWISIRSSLKFVPKVPVDNKPSLVQILAWHRPGNHPLSEPMTVSLLTHICVTRPQWVKYYVKTSLWRGFDYIRVDIVLHIIREHTGYLKFINRMPLGGCSVYLKSLFSNHDSRSLWVYFGNHSLWLDHWNPHGC